MATDNVTPINQGIRTDGRRQHAQSRLAGRLFAIFDQLCAVTRESRELGEDLDDSLLRRIGGRDAVAEDSPLHDALMAVCNAAYELARSAEPGEYRTPRPRP